MKARLACIASAVALVAGGAFAGDEVRLPARAHQTDQASAPGSARVASVIADDFSGFAGSQANADSLVAGLRTASPVVLTAPASPNQAPATTTFDLPTRPMGYGNVFVSLALAKQQLAGYGIAQPTPDQLKAALVGGSMTSGSGGSTVSLPGVLTLRSQGAGWGKIANAMGVKLGTVVSELRTASRLTHGSAQAAAAPARSISGARGITTAAGASMGQEGGLGRGLAPGVVTGTGAAAGARGEADFHDRGHWK